LHPPLGVLRLQPNSTDRTTIDERLLSRWVAAQISPLPRYDDDVNVVSDVEDMDVSAASPSCGRDWAISGGAGDAGGFAVQGEASNVGDPFPKIVRGERLESLGLLIEGAAAWPVVEAWAAERRVKSPIARLH
jgi:hypothetical protein